MIDNTADDDPPSHLEAPSTASEGQRHLIITVHGIRTYGEWQGRLRRLVTVVEPDAQVVEYRYGLFSSLAFWFPLTRWIEVRRFRRWLSRTTTAAEWRRIDVVAHSFGTHIVAWALHGTRTIKQRLAVHTTILAGSVLKPGFPWQDLVGKTVHRVINDCGLRDGVLVLNAVLVFFTGMAGRLGFYGIESNRFRNRFFRFGHSGYFSTWQRSRSSDSARRADPDEFMRTMWVPLLTRDEPIEEYSERMERTSWKEVVTATLLRSVDTVKLVVYLVLIGMPALVFYDLYEKALSKALALEARNHLEGRPDLGMLLAAEAARRSGTVEAKGSMLTTFVQRPNVIGLLHLPPVDAAPEAVHLARQVLKLSPDGRVVALGTVDGKIVLWSLETRRMLGSPLIGHSGTVRALAFSTDGRMLASAGNDGKVLLWDLRASRLVATPLMGKASFVTAVSFSPNGQEVVAGYSDGSAVVFDVSTGRPRKPELAAGAGPVLAIAYRDAGRTILSVGQAGAVIEWSAETLSGRKVLRADVGDSGTIYAGVAVLSASGSALAETDAEGTILSVTNLEDRTPLRIQAQGPGQAYTGAMSFAADGNILAFGTLGSRIMLLNIRSRTFLGDGLAGHAGPIVSLDFSSGVNLVVSTDLRSRVTIFDTATLGESRSIGGLVDLAVSPNGPHIAAGYKTGEVVTWRRSPPKPNPWQAITIRALDPNLRVTVGSHAHPVGGVAFSPDGRMFASVGMTQDVLFWRAEDGAQLRASRNDASRIAPARGLAFSHDGKLLASGQMDGNVVLLDTDTGERYRTLPGHSMPVATAAFSSIGRGLVSGALDGKTILWADVDRDVSGEVLGEHGAPITATAFSPDGITLATGTRDNLVVLWDKVQRTKLSELRGHRAAVHAAAFSRDGGTLVTGDVAGGILFWDVLSRRQLTRISTPHGAGVSQLMFLSDGKTFIAGDREGYYVTIDLETTSWPARLCRLANRDLTEQEWREYVGIGAVEYYIRVVFDRTTCPAQTSLWQRLREFVWETDGGGRYPTW